MEDEPKINIVSKKAQARIYKDLKLNNTNSEWIGEIKAFGDVVISPPSYENIYINRKFNLEKISLSDGLYENLYEIDRYVDFTIRLLILVINEELRVECPRKFAGQVVYLGEKTVDNRNFCFIYGFGN